MTLLRAIPAFAALGVAWIALQAVSLIAADIASLLISH